MRIGVDLGGTKIEAIVLKDGGGEIFRHRIAAPTGDYDATLDAVAGLVAEADCAAGRGAHTVGIGIPGAVSPATGLVKNANSTWLIGKPLGTDLAARLGRPVRIENDANCFALSEAADGAAEGAATVFGVILGTGVGGGIVVGGQPLIGANAIAGEWGHNPLPSPTPDERPGQVCYCGRTGCIETWLSGPALARDHARHTGEDVTAAEIAMRADAGDPGATATLERYAARLAKALAAVVNVLDPDAIVLGGGLSNIAVLYDAVPELMTPHVFSDVCVTPMLPPKHGDSSGVRGAAWLWPEGIGQSAPRLD